MTMSLLVVPTPGSLRILTFLPGNMFVFLFAGHEVGSLPSPSDAASIQFSTDYDAYTMFLIRLVGSVSW